MISTKKFLKKSTFSVTISLYYNKINFSGKAQKNIQDIGVKTLVKFLNRVD